MFTTTYLNTTYKIAFYYDFFSVHFKRRKTEGDYDTVRTTAVITTGDEKNGVVTVTTGSSTKSIDDFHNKALAKIWALFYAVKPLINDDSKNKNLAYALFFSWFSHYKRTRCGKRNIEFLKWADILIHCLKTGDDPHKAATELKDK